MCSDDMAQKGLLHQAQGQTDQGYSAGEASRTLKVLAVHTGGLQGIAGVEQRLGEKIFPD